MKTSEQINDLLAALSLAQGEFPQVKMSGNNPHFKCKYSTLADLREATQPALTKHGLSISQFPSAENGIVNITTLLAHKSGQYIETDLTLKPDRINIQGIGSTISYGRRYAKAAVLDVVGEEDDDGEAAMNHLRPIPKPVTPKFYEETVAESKAKIFELFKKYNLDEVEKMKRISEDAVKKRILMKDLEAFVASYAEG